MQELSNFFCKNKKTGKWEGTIKLSFEMEESVYLLELLIKKEEKIVVYDLNELNCLFESKYKKAYTVAQYQTMSKVLMILDGLSTSNIHLFSGCEYKNGKIGFEKGTYFKLCSCLIESKRNIREREKSKEKSKLLPSPEKIMSLPNQNKSAMILPQQKNILTQNTQSIQNNETNILTNKKIENSDIGGISKEDFKRQIQARKNK